MMLSPAAAQERTTIGYARLFNNDFLGDGQDRWRTGSYVISKIRAPSWDGQRPEGFGELLEYRLRTEIIAPENLAAPLAGDRRMATALSLGVHTHFARGNVDFSLGGDLVIVGPQNGIGSFQREMHKLFGATDPSVALANQIGNHFYPALTAEIARPFRLSPNATLRPFAEFRAGPENMVRVGADFILGPVGQRDLLLRDVTSGHLIRGTREETPGLSLMLGADIARVFDSAYLPSSDGYVLTDHRDRVRLGVNWQGRGGAAVFYGLTWLGEEFIGQGDSQVVGSVQLNILF